MHILKHTLPIINNRQRRLPLDLIGRIGARMPQIMTQRSNPSHKHLKLAKNPHNAVTNIPTLHQHGEDGERMRKVVVAQDVVVVADLGH